MVLTYSSRELRTRLHQKVIFYFSPLQDRRFVFHIGFVTIGGVCRIGRIGLLNLTPDFNLRKP